MFAECRTENAQHTCTRTRSDRRTPVDRAHISRVRRASSSGPLTLARAAANLIAASPAAFALTNIV